MIQEWQSPLWNPLSAWPAAVTVPEEFLLCSPVAWHLLRKRAALLENDARELVFLEPFPSLSGRAVLGPHETEWRQRTLWGLAREAGQAWCCDGGRLSSRESQPFPSEKR